MSLKDTDVKTPGNKAIAKKWKLSSSEVNKLVKQGANHEKEHNTNIEKAKQVARDHIGERPDYYKMLDKADKMDKNKLKEDIINELSNKLMKKYMKRAKGELNARDYVTRSGGDYQKKPDLFQHGPAWPGDHEVTDQYAKIHKRQRGMERATALMNIREVKTYGRVSRPGWKPSKDSTTPASPGEPKGDAMKNAFDRIEKAFPKGSIKVGGRKEMKEDTVNEIADTPKGQSTLVKYVRGAAKDLHNTGLIHGYDSAANPRPNGGETETRKNMKRNAKNRTVGIERAVKRMNPGLKEEQMDINEISSKLATRYYDKADKDLPKQKKNSRKLHNRQTGIQRAMKRGIEDDYIKRTGYNEETTMEKQDMVAEAINNILEGNLENMRQNLFDVLQETAIEKLEERKKEIASNYFAQD